MTDEFMAVYGNPDVDGDHILDTDWFLENIRIFTMPYPLVIAWKPAEYVSRFQAHKLAGDQIVAALSRMAAYKGIDFLRSNQFDRWGGGFNFRLARGRQELSSHSWGTAVDMNPDKGRLGSVQDARAYPRFIIDAFEAEGFLWGGNWNRPDAMHFQL